MFFLDLIGAFVLISQLCGSVYALVENKTEVLNRNLFQKVICSLCGLAK